RFPASDEYWQRPSLARPAISAASSVPVSTSPLPDSTQLCVNRASLPARATACPSAVHRTCGAPSGLRPSTLVGSTLNSAPTTRPSERRGNMPTLLLGPLPDA